MEKQKVKFELVESKSLTRHPCHVCGGSTDKVPILAEVKEGQFKGLRVCEQCMEKRDFDARLLAYAEALEANAALVRSLVGRLEVPTFEEYQARYAEYELKILQDDIEGLTERGE